MKFQHMKRWRVTAERALAQGADRPTFMTIRHDVSGNCEKPIYREYYGAEAVAHALGTNRTTRRGAQMTMEIDARCRACPTCLKARAAHWRARCTVELRDAPRTWFGTLTFRPEEVYRAKCAVNLRLLTRSTTWDHQDEDTKFRLMAQELGKEVTLYLKRLRKQGASLRYCLVVEAHKSGVPHFHMLVHEVNEHSPVRHKLLADQWRAGFSKWNLVEIEDLHRAAYYVTKYLTKSTRARIRASEDYGISPLGIADSLLSRVKEENLTTMTYKDEPKMEEEMTTVSLLEATK